MNSNNKNEWSVPWMTEEESMEFLKKINDLGRDPTREEEREREKIRKELEKLKRTMGESYEG